MKGMTGKIQEQVQRKWKAVEDCSKTTKPRFEAAEVRSSERIIGR
jgi:hypothetical protein